MLPNSKFLFGFALLSTMGALKLHVCFLPLSCIISFTFFFHSQ